MFEHDPRLTDYLLDEMSAEQRLEFEAELEGSAELRAQLAALRKTINVLETTFGADDQPAHTLTAEQQQNIITAASLEEKYRRTERNRRASWPQWLGIAAGVLVVVGLAAFALRDRGKMEANPAVASIDPVKDRLPTPEADAQPVDETSGTTDAPVFSDPFGDMNDPFGSAEPGGVAPNSSEESMPAIQLQTALPEVEKRLNERLLGELTEGREDAEDAKQQSGEKPNQTWKPATASTNAARLSVGQHDDLPLAARDTYVRIDGFRARVLLDCYYYNDRAQQLEGKFLLRLPDDASLHYFAFGPTPLATPAAAADTGKPAESVEGDAARQSVAALRTQTNKDSGSDLARRAVDPNYAADADSLFALVKAARIVTKQKAALAYEETVRRRVDPALVEWAGPGIFQTRVFPLVPNQLHRIVIGYDVNLKEDGDALQYLLELPSEQAGGRVEFDIAAQPGFQVSLDPQTEPFISGSRAYYRFDDVQQTQYSVRLQGAESVLLTDRSEHGQDYFATRLSADLPDEPAKVDSPRAVFLLDTSWSERPAAFSRRLKLLEQILLQNRDSVSEFAVLMFNVEQRWWQSGYRPNDDASVTDFLALADTLVLEGATDLNAALSAATDPDWIRGKVNQPMPNLFLLSDAAATWGATEWSDLTVPLQSIDRAHGGGALFTYALAGFPTDKVAMQALADASGGAVFDVAEQQELESAAVAHRSRPWRVANTSGQGSEEILIRGGSGAIYPGQSLLVAGRGRLTGPLEITLQRGDETQTLTLQPQIIIKTPAAARLFGQLASERLAPIADEVETVAVAIDRHFRIPGRLCSLVMLDTAEDYQRFAADVSPAEDALVIATTSVTESVARVEKQLAERRVDGRQRFLRWLESLEGEQSFIQVPAALRLAIERLPSEAFEMQSRMLQCQAWQLEHAARSYRDELLVEQPGFENVLKEAERRLVAYGAADAVKVASTLVESRPADVDTLRSVAFHAMQWQRADQAAPLLWRLTMARPYQPQTLLLLARSLEQTGKTDWAIVCYELVVSGNWNERWQGAKPVAAVELLHLLEGVVSGERKSDIADYAGARLNQLRDQWGDEGLDVAIVMHWTTDRSDVDLHVIEPSGEECFYSHNRTASGGAITQDITQGLGPEMYTLETAPAGAYKVAAKYYRSDDSRTRAPTEVLITTFRDIGRSTASRETKLITLEGTGEKQAVATVTVK